MEKAGIILIDNDYIRSLFTPKEQKEFPLDFTEEQLKIIASRAQELLYQDWDEKFENLVWSCVEESAREYIETLE